MTSDAVELSWPIARERARTTFSQLSIETIALSEGDGRTLAETALALCDLPTADNSAMDGWAVAGAGPWRIVGEALAGGPLVESLEPGTCVRIGTGGVVPLQTHAVLRWEDADESEGVVALKADVELSAHKDIRPAGLECRVGDVLIHSGTRLNPASLGLLAAAGHDQVRVARRPTVAILILGDELVHSGIPQRGQVRDSLSAQLPAWVKRLGGDVDAVAYVPDQLEPLVDAIAEQIASADLVLTSGSTADGPRDYLHDALHRLDAEVLIDRVRVRPGHPMLLARLSGKPVIGLPGNPQSAVVGMMTLGAPVLNSLLGAGDEAHQEVELGEDVSAPRDFTRLLIGRNENSKFVSMPWVGSNMLRGLAASNGFAVIPPGGASAGTTVAWLPLP